MRVEDEILPELEERFQTFYLLRKHDIGSKSNIIKLIAYQEKLGINDNEDVCMVIDHTHVLNGYRCIKSNLFVRVNECVANRLKPGWRPPEPVTVPGDTGQGVELARERAEAFTTAAVLTAGLLDGINPCAMATLVFFISLLAVSGFRGRALVTVGFAFCVGCFVTYTLIGFGLLRALYMFKGYPRLQEGIEIALVVMLGIFAVISFRDAWRYRITGNAEDVKLQLPHSIKIKIHHAIRKGIRTRNLLVGGVLTGVTVTAFESICTGQVYLPTLVLVVKEGESDAGIWMHLLLYNIMFILPLVILFALFYSGLRTETLIQWSKRNVVLSKALLGVFFVSMAVLICLT